MNDRHEEMTNPRERYHGQYRDFPLTHYPDYEPHRPPRSYILEQRSFLDEVEAIWGNTWGGSQGIGKLRQMALLRPTAHEVDELFDRDPRFFLLRRVKMDIRRLTDALEGLGSCAEEHGVNVRWMETPERMGAYGPMRKLFMGALPLVIKGGAIISRQGQASYMRGLEVNFQQFFTEIRCPILLSVHGYGICEVGVFVPIAEDVIAGYRSNASNLEGLSQVITVMKSHGVRAVPVAHSTMILDDFDAGGEFHLDMVFGMADHKLAVVYPGYLDYSFYNWLRRYGINFIEVPRDEHHQWYPANFLLLEPGLVIMPAGAKETIKRVRDAGVEVVEFDNSGLMAGTNGIRCVVLPLERDSGPSLEIASEDLL
jgi:N-dimethylarginine dimethylaminohydrolase